MNRNNRMPVYQEKEFEPRKVRSRVLKDGKYIFVDGPQPNPYKGVPCASLKIGSRIESGTFENHEAGLRHLERAQGSDIAQVEIENSQKDYEDIKSRAKLEQSRKEFEKKVQEESERLNKNSKNKSDENSEE